MFANRFRGLERSGVGEERVDSRENVGNVPAATMLPTGAMSTAGREGNGKATGRRRETQDRSYRRIPGLAWSGESRSGRYDGLGCGTMEGLQPLGHRPTSDSDQPLRRAQGWRSPVQVGLPSASPEFPDSKPRYDPNRSTSENPPSWFLPSAMEVYLAVVPCLSS